MLRISQRQSGDRIVVHLGGDLTAETVDTLRDCLAEGELTDRAPSPPVRIELSELRFLDAVGAHLLAEAEATGREIDGASPYVELLIERHRTPVVPTSESVAEPMTNQTQKETDSHEG